MILAAILFDDNPSKEEALNVKRIKTNKVIVARPESKDAGAFPHSPLFNDSISHPGQHVNTLGESSSESEKASSSDAPKKIVFAQKKDFDAADIEYHIPGYKKPIAYSTKATADSLESIAEDNPTATISQIRKTKIYDEEAYKVLDAYISNGLGNKTVGEMFTHDKDHIIHREETTDEKNGGQKGSGKALRKDNGRTVRPSSGAGEGTSRLLDEVQAEDVQRAGGQGNASETPEQRGGQADRLGDRTDETFGSRGSDGSREVGDLRRDDVVNEAEKKTKDESLKKVVDEQIEQKSTQSSKGNNFVISDSLSLPQDEQQIADGEDKTISHGGKDKKSVLLCKISIKLLKKLRSLMQKHLSMDAEKKSVYTAFMHNFYAPICIDENNCIAKIAGDESYSPGMDGTNKKFYHVRAIEIETAPSVGIGNGHTPIMESTASNVTISEVYSLVKQFDKDFMQGGIKSLPYCSTPTQGRFGKQSQIFKTEDSEVIRRRSRVSIISNRETSS